MEYISGYCTTNLDDYDCGGFTEFVAVPRKGERVEVKYKNNLTVLWVVGVIHKHHKDRGPYIVVELNKLTL